MNYFDNISVLRPDSPAEKTREDRLSVHPDLSGAETSLRHGPGPVLHLNTALVQGLTGGPSQERWATLTILKDKPSRKVQK